MERAPIVVGALSTGVASPDAVMQARQLTVPLGTPVSFPLSMIDGTSGTYTVATNNPGVVGFALNGACTASRAWFRCRLTSSGTSSVNRSMAVVPGRGAVLEDEACS